MPRILSVILKVPKYLIPIDVAFYGVVVLLILGPLLLPGYVLTLDMVFTPELRMPDQVSSSYLFRTLLHGLDLVLPADAVQKLMLAAIFLLAGCGMYRLVSLLAVYNKLPSTPAALYFAGLLYMVNPFTYGRLMAGQYQVLFGYVLLPWFARAMYLLVKQPSWRRALAVAAWSVAISIVSIHTIGMALIIAALVLARQLWQDRTERKRWGRLLKYAGGVAGVWLVASSYWLLPAFAGVGQQAQIVSSFTASDRQAFATTGSNPAERIGNVLGLQGFWAERYGLYMLPQDEMPEWLWVLLMLLIIGLVVVGGVVWWRRAGARGDTAVFISYIVMGALLAAGIGSGWLAAHVPFFAGYREPHKFTSLLALGYGVLAAGGFAAVAGWLQRPTRQRPQAGGASGAGAAAGLLLALPVLVTTTIWWGAKGQLQAAEYPAGWYAVNRQLNSDNDDFQTLFLPWHMYMYFDFAGRLTATPARLFFDKPVITSDDPELKGAALNKAPPTTRKIDAWLKAAPDNPNKQAFGAMLARADIKYVILAKDSDYGRYDYLDKQKNLMRIADYPDIALYRVEGYSP